MILSLFSVVRTIAPNKRHSDRVSGGLQRLSYQIRFLRCLHRICYFTNIENPGVKIESCSSFNLIKNAMPGRIRLLWIVRAAVIWNSDDEIYLRFNCPQVFGCHSRASRWAVET